MSKLRNSPREAAVPAPAHPQQLTRESLPPDLQTALDAAVEKKARAPVILQVTEITGYTDWVLIVSGRSDRHVAAIADGIAQALAERGTKPRGTEGLGEHSWDLLDYDDFMVHVFYHPVRMHYDLESMWSDAPRVTLDLPPDVMDTSDLDSLEAPGDLPAYRGDMVFGGYEDEFGDDLDDEGFDEFEDAEDFEDDDAVDEAFDDDETSTPN